MVRCLWVQSVSALRRQLRFLSKTFCLCPCSTWWRVRLILIQRDKTRKRARQNWSLLKAGLKVHRSQSPVSHVLVVQSRWYWKLDLLLRKASAINRLLVWSLAERVRCVLLASRWSCSPSKVSLSLTQLGTVIQQALRVGGCFEANTRSGILSWTQCRSLCRSMPYEYEIGLCIPSRFLDL